MGETRMLVGVLEVIIQFLEFFHFNPRLAATKELLHTSESNIDCWVARKFLLGRLGLVLLLQQFVKIAPAEKHIIIK
jgi:hypothetical protein